MPIHVDWYDEDAHIILTRHIGHWEVQDLVASNAKINQLAQSTTERFDIISDSSEAAFTLPIGMLWAWQQNAQAREKLLPNWHLSIFIVSSPVHEAYFNEGIQTSDIIRKHSRIAKNIKEAVAIILEDRQAQTDSS